MVVTHHASYLVAIVATVLPRSQPWPLKCFSGVGCRGANEPQSPAGGNVLVPEREDEGRTGRVGRRTGTGKCSRYLH